MTHGAVARCRHSTDTNRPAEEVNGNGCMAGLERGGSVTAQGVVAAAVGAPRGHGTRCVVPANSTELER